MQIRASLLALTLLLPAISLAGPNPEYRFERLWPPLHQPWYFSRIGCIAEDASGNVYVPDGQNDLIRKFTRDGSLISQWGNQGTGGQRLDAPQCVKIGPDGLVYVAAGEHIHVFNADGQFQRWLGGFGDSCPARFEFAVDIGFDSQQRLFVLDSNNHQIQRFENLGLCLNDFPGYDPGGSQSDPCVIPPINACTFSWPVGDVMVDDFPRDMAVHAQAGNDRVYVAETDLQRITRFDVDGSNAVVVAAAGTGPGQVDTPQGVSVDEQGNLYIADFGNNRLQILDAAGSFVREIAGSADDQLGRFFLPTTVTPLANGEYYVTDNDATRVLRYDAADNVTANWTSAGDTPGRLWFPLGVATGVDTDATQRLFVADQRNNRIQVFNLDGSLDRVITEYLADGQPISVQAPANLLIDDGFLYVHQEFDSIHKIELATLTREWVLPDPAAVDPNHPLGGPCLDKPNNDFGRGLALHNGELFATDPNVTDATQTIVFPRIRRLDLDGNCLGDIGTGTLSFPGGVAIVAPAGGPRRLWVADSDFDGTLANIKVFDPQSGAQTDTIGSRCNDPVCGPAQFEKPSGLVVFESDQAAPQVIVTEANIAFDPLQYPLRVQVFDATGNFITGFGPTGVGTGQFQFPTNAAVSTAGDIFVTDAINNRLQKFTRQAAAGNPRAIVVAGGGPYPGNALWAATQSNANFAFTALASRGFTKDTVQYLSADTNLDLDLNGLADEVDGDTTVAGIRQAILGPSGQGTDGFAGDPAVDHLVVYLLDHGGDNAFRVSAGEVLGPAALNGWLRTWQDAHPNAQLTLIYDACQSGSFIDELGASDRLVITSASDTESAYFVSQGTLSFSNLFWSQIFLGLEVDDAYVLAADAITAAFPLQHPQLEADGIIGANSPADLARADGRSLGSATLVAGDRPIIGSVSAPTEIIGTNSATIGALNVTDADGISRVWVVMRPPGFNPGSASNPVNDLPTFDLAPTSGEDYAATFNGFSDPGIWQLTVYALDDLGNTSIPQSLTITVDSPLTRKAIVVVGGLGTDPALTARQVSAQRAFQALSEQGYGSDGAQCNVGGPGAACDFSCDNICFLSPLAGAGFDAAPDQANLMAAITGWGTAGVQDLTLYLAAQSDGAGGYRLNDSAADNIAATDLAGWLDTAQSTLPGTVTVIVEGDDSQTFLGQLALATGGSQILLGSTAAGETATMLQAGQVSFSRYFWTQVFNGATVRQGFSLASAALRFGPTSAQPQLDDNGDGISNSFADGRRAATYAIGSGVLLAGDEPLVGSISVNATLVSDFEGISVSGVTTTSAIDRVIAVVEQPDGKIVEQILPATGSTYGDRSFALCGPVGAYSVSAVALDTRGNASLPVTTTTNRATECTDFLFHAGFE